MDDNRTTPRPRGKHLLERKTVADAVDTIGDTAGDVDLTRHRGQGNGVRVHGIYFAVVSLAALVLVIAFIAFAGTKM